MSDRYDVDDGLCAVEGFAVEFDPSFFDVVKMCGLFLVDEEDFSLGACLLMRFGFQCFEKIVACACE